MTFAIGGTAKVRRVVKQARTERWMCNCVTYRETNDEVNGEDIAIDLVFRKTQDASLTRCPECGTRRP